MLDIVWACLSIKSAPFGGSSILTCTHMMPGYFQQEWGQPCREDSIPTSKAIDGPFESKVRIPCETGGVEQQYITWITIWHRDMGCFDRYLDECWTRGLDECKKICCIFWSSRVFIRVGHTKDSKIQETPSQQTRHCRAVARIAHGTPMEFSKHSLEIVPPDWTGYLDPSSFLALQCAHVSSFSDAQCIESFWCNLCRNQLRCFLATSGPPADIHLDANSIKHSLTRRGRDG